MEVRMEHTEGLGRTAQVWVDGTLLCVCDGLSTPDARHAPGLVENAKFSYMTGEGFSWVRAARQNPSHRMQIDPVARWSYVGFGRVLQVAPVIVDFDLLTLQDANWTTDQTLVGQYVRIPIDRLDITAAAASDWPDEMK